MGSGCSADASGEQMSLVLREGGASLLFEDLGPEAQRTRPLESGFGCNKLSCRGAVLLKCGGSTTLPSQGAWKAQPRGSVCGVHLECDPFYYY